MHGAYQVKYKEYTRSQDRPLHGRIPKSFMIFEFTLLGTGSADSGDQHLKDNRCAWAMSARKRVDPETVKHRVTEKSHVDWTCRFGVEGFNRMPQPKLGG